MYLYTLGCIYFMRMGALLTSMYVYYVRAWYSQKPEESTRCYGTGVAADCELHCGC